VEKCGDIGGNQILALTEADHQRRSVAEGNNHLGLGQMNRHHRILSLEAGQHGKDTLSERTLLATEELGDKLGVGIGLQLDTHFEEFPAQAAIVFDDAIVNHRHLTAAVGLRVGVGLGGRTMGRPPRMTDADRAVQRFVIRLLLQVAELSGGTQDLDLIRPHDRDSGRVVAAILEAAKTIEEDRNDLVRADVTDDATHSQTPTQLTMS